MNSHLLLAYLPAPLLAGALVLDLLRIREPGSGRGSWIRILVAGGLGASVLTAFAGLGARRRLASALPGDATPWDGHVVWAVLLLVPLLALGFVRLRRRWPDEARGRWLLVLLDALLVTIAVTILATGIRAP